MTIFAGNFLAVAKNDKPGSENPRQKYKVYVDKNGVMRRSDTKEEVSYYGTNYTLPFAHAYRAVGELGIDRKDAISRDVYHLKRLGFNGFRLHLWDVELTDSAGNLLDNDHLDLLDFLIAELEKQGIDIVLTAQTNFGNGYPEKNIDTGAYSYDYGKCEIHSNKDAQNIQSNYLTQLASHLNPYTGLTYSGDNAIIAMEINNEPCHTDSPKEVTQYINKMVKALKKGGFDKPILYNVSHNPDVTEAYYNADIQGTTYQWYPTGLVSGHQRKGNFLPILSEYQIPWKDSMKNYDKLARVVYEFDPGDVLDSYLYPAIARTFRKEGFQWITQFAYDPIDIAKYNTEYQTHFLNLAYTPTKAISMMIAGEVARNVPRGADYGVFPADTVFSDFTVSYVDDLSLYNSPQKFYHSNSTKTQPVNIESLTNIAGVGSSNLVKYNGTGAYFLDEVNPGVWRLELMPDVVLVDDPFKKPSLKKEIAKIFYQKRNIDIDLPQLGQDYYFKGINEGNYLSGKAKNGSFEIEPGVYLLARNEQLIAQTLENSEGENSELRQYVAPAPSNSNSIVVHNPSTYINRNGDVVVEAYVYGNEAPQNVWIYPDYVSFWNDNNTLIPMERVGESLYRAVIPQDQAGWGKEFKYNIVVNEGDRNYTWPQNIEGTPLDWDFTDYAYYSSRKIDGSDKIVLVNPEDGYTDIEVTMIPEAWDFQFESLNNAPVGKDSYQLTSTPKQDGKLVIRKYVGDDLNNAPYLEDKQFVIVKLLHDFSNPDLSIQLTGKNGATYSSPLSPSYLEEGIPSKLHQDKAEGYEYRIPLSAFSQTEINIVPTVYPSFLQRVVEIGSLPFEPAETEYVDIVFPTKKGQQISAMIEGVWLE